MQGGGGGSGGGAVDSVANSDGTLTISPTTGNVVASVNTAKANTWTASQTIGQVTYSSQNGGTSITSQTVWGSSGSGAINIGTAANNQYIQFISGAYGIYCQFSQSILIFNSLELHNAIFQQQPSTSATSSNTSVGSYAITMNGSYWNGTSSITYGGNFAFYAMPTTSQSYYAFQDTLNNLKAKIDLSGNITHNGVFYTNNADTTLSGTTSGTVSWNMPQQGSAKKYFRLYMNAYENTTATAQTITYPTAFSTATIVMGNNTGTTISTTLTTLTLPSSMSAAATGLIIIEGY